MGEPVNEETDKAPRGDVCPGTSEEPAGNTAEETAAAERLEDGPSRVKAVPFDIYALVRRAAAGEVPQAAEKGVGVECSLSARVPECLAGDPYTLRSALSGVLDTALGVTKSGELRTALSLLDDCGESVRVRLEISGIGAGLPEEERKRLVMDLSRPLLPGGEEPDQEGSCLSKRLFTGMGGRVRVKQTPCACTYIADLRLFKTDEPPVALPDESGGLPFGVKPVKIDRTDGGNAAVLAVFSPPEERRCAVRLLRILGCRVDTAKNGAEAAEKCAARVYGLILLGRVGDGEQGFDVSALRAGVLNAATPVAAVATDGEAPSRADYALPSPLTLKALEEVVNRVL